MATQILPSLALPCQTWTSHLGLLKVGDLGLWMSSQWMGGYVTRYKWGRWTFLPFMVQGHMVLLINKPATTFVFLRTWLQFRGLSTICGHSGKLHCTTISG